LKAGLILLLDKHGYPPVERDEVYQDIFDQAENFKKNRVKGCFWSRFEYFNNQ
jgi:type I restriction enzyme R subunit